MMKLTPRLLRVGGHWFVLALLIFPLSSHGAVREHSQMKGPYGSVRDVTRACLGCHQTEGMELLRSSHWTWERQRIINGKPVKYAKSTALDFFAIQARGNPVICQPCHLHNTPELSEDQPPDPSRIDCLVCHDTTGSHRNQAEASSQAEDLLHLARSVGRPSVSNCLRCHRDHCLEADSDKRMATIQDVHLDTGGAGMRCQSCHLEKGRHAIVRLPGSTPSQAHPSKGCTSCHGENPHGLQELNRHGELVSCQTCHIPLYGTSSPALLSWNWLASGHNMELSQAGMHGEKQPLFQAHGFTLADNIIPAYRWDDGSDLLYQRGSRISPDRITLLQEPGKRTIRSQIRPFRIIYGTQLYDAKYRYLISPQLSAEAGRLFPNTGWTTIAHQGMEEVRLPYSGQYGITLTATFRRLNHGVVPASQALGCLDCHKNNSRLPWRELGYAGDPWVETSGEKIPRPQAGQEIPTPETRPIEEIILRPEQVP